VSRDGHFAAALPMNSSTASLCRLLALLAALPACTELRARREAREGNGFFLEGNYSAAAEKYRAAEQLLPSLPVIAFNRGLACRQLMLPGSKTAENERFVRCALEAFDRYKKLAPSDPRGDQLYVQTLFDADRFENLVGIYEAELAAAPGSLAAINGLIQVYSRWDRFQETLNWTIRRAEVARQDAEAQYAVGVLVWNRLFQRGGSGARAQFDPRVEGAVPPPTSEGEILGEERVRLADQGIAFLERALALRPAYREAMIYANLLYRQKSYAYFEQPAEYQAALDKAEAWRQKATQADLTQKSTVSPRR
jgi:hypothetical protein